MRWAAPVAVGLVAIVVWHTLVKAFNVPHYLVPSPALVVQTLIADWGLLFGSLLVTLKITFGAFFMAVLVGTVVAFLFVQSRWVEVSFFPYAVLLQVTPIVAIAPLIIIWVRNPTAALVARSRMTKGSRWQTLMRLRIPSAAPYFFGGLRISSGLALIGAVVAEFAAGTGGTSAGLAYQILQAGFSINIPRLFAALILITVTGVLLFLLMVLLSKLALGNWHESEIKHEV